MANANILMVEDNPHLYLSTQRRLKSHDFATYYASDAVECMCKAQQHHPDLILLDLGLPAGDGYVVMERLKAFSDLALIPIVVLSGRDRASNELKSLRAGATAFLQKPVCGDLLVETIRKCLSMRERADAKAMLNDASVAPTAGDASGRGDRQQPVDEFERADLKRASVSSF